MLHAVCDLCGLDCKRVGYFITITPFQDFARYEADTEIFGFKEKTKSCVVCQDCKAKLPFANPFEKRKIEDVGYARVGEVEEE